MACWRPTNLLERLRELDLELQWANKNGYLRNTTAGLDTMIDVRDTIAKLEDLQFNHSQGKSDEESR